MADADTKPTNPNEEEEAKKPPVEDENLPPQPENEEPVEEPAEEPEEELEEENEEPVEEETPEQPPMSRREALRVNQLLEKYGRPEQRPDYRDPGNTKHLTDEQMLDYSKELDADPEVLDRLNKDRNDTIERVYARGRQEGQSQADSLLFNTRLEIDVPRVEAKYSFLDKRSPDFDAEWAKAVNLRYLDFVGYDQRTRSVRRPDVRYADFVEAEIEFAERQAKRIADRRQDNTSKQAASTGLRPDGSGAKRLNLNKAPQDMSDEELDAFLKRNLPSK